MTLDIAMSESNADLDARVRRLESLLEEIAASVRPPTLWQRILFGVTQGFGTIVGATVVVALAVALLRPLTHIEYVGARLERILDVLEKRDTADRR
jgi:ABC-type Fe3+ transport system permease subunit